MFAIKNLASQSCTTTLPWEFDKAQEYDKEDWNDPQLEHCFFSGISGGIPAQRVSKSNPATQLHAVVADYDANYAGENLKATVIKRCKTEWSPNWVCRTRSGGVRAVWLLETPLPITTSTAKRLMQRVVKRLKPDALFSGFDREAFYDVHKYYEVGREWVQLHDVAIDASTMGQWLVEATQNEDWSKQGIEIPPDDLADRVQELYPGKWPGVFDIGMRGPRFWDDTADNDTAAIVRETGMQCFTGAQSFVPWKQLLGSKWVNRFESDRVSSAVSDIFFDGQFYWALGSNGWRCMNRTDIGSHLKVKCGLSSRPDSNGISAVERAIVTVQDLQQVDSVVKSPATPPGVLYRNGERILNTLERYCIAPEEGSFKYIDSYLNSLLENEEQLLHLLAWMQYAYKSGLDLDMQPGQTLFLVGKTNTGKTLFSTVLLAGLLGSSMDAADFLTGRDDWSGPLLEHAVWTVDDVTALASSASSRHWNSMLKKMVANRSFTVKEKYRRDVSTVWNGRVVVTLNDDAQSLGVLPDLDISNQDKVMVLRCHEERQEFPTDAAKQIRAELPAFAHWLKNWTPPAHVISGGRYHVHGFLAPELEEEARQNSSSHAIFELLITYMDGMSMTEPLKGSATDIHGLLSETGSPVEAAMRQINPNMLGRHLGSLNVKFPELVERVRRTHSRGWVISPDIIPKDEE